MKLLTFSVEAKARPGVLKGDRVIDLAAAGLPAGPHGGLIEIARGGDAMLDRVCKVLNDGNTKSYAIERGPCKGKSCLARISQLLDSGVIFFEN